MTTQPFTPANPEIVNGTGPYVIPHGYAGKAAITGEFRTAEGQSTALAPEMFSVDPEESTTTGNLTLTATAASTFDGQTLIVKRQTETQQGWAGNYPREISLEKQLDLIVQAVQELSYYFQNPDALPRLINADLIDGLEGAQIARKDISQTFRGSIISDAGAVVSRAAPNENAHFWLRDENNKRAGLIYWNAANGNVHIRRYDTTTEQVIGEIRITENGILLNGSEAWRKGDDAGLMKKGFPVGDEAPSQGYLGHDDGQGSNKAVASKNRLLAVKGTDAEPDSETRYAHTSIFSELHTDTALAAAQSVWGNPYKVGSIVGEAIAHPGFEGELNGGVFRAYSPSAPANLTDPSKRILVGGSSIGQTNPGSGNAAYDVWGFNSVAAQTSGNAPQNIVGHESDVIHVSTANAPMPGTFGATNYTAYWAQSDAQAGSVSDTAFLATHTAQSGGWRQILLARGKIDDWAIYLESEITTVNAKGIFYKTAYEGANGRLLELHAGTREQMRIEAEADNPVQLRVGNSLKRVVAGPADSAGAGFRSLRVAN